MKRNNRITLLKKFASFSLSLQLILLPLAEQRSQANPFFDLRKLNILRQQAAKLSVLEKKGWVFYDSKLKRVNIENLLAGSKEFVAAAPFQKDVKTNLCIRSRFIEGSNGFKVQLKTFEFQNPSQTLAERVIQIDSNASPEKNKADRLIFLKQLSLDTIKALKVLGRFASVVNPVSVQQQFLNWFLPSAQASNTVDNFFEFLLCFSDIFFGFAVIIASFYLLGGVVLRFPPIKLNESNGALKTGAKILLYAFLLDLALNLIGNIATLIATSSEEY